MEAASLAFVESCTHNQRGQGSDSQKQNQPTANIHASCRRVWLHGCLLPAGGVHSQACDVRLSKPSLVQLCESEIVYARTSCRKGVGICGIGHREKHRLSQPVDLNCKRG